MWPTELQNDGEREEVGYRDAAHIQYTYKDLQTSDVNLSLFLYYRQEPIKRNMD